MIENVIGFTKLISVAFVIMIEIDLLYRTWLPLYSWARSHVAWFGAESLIMASCDHGFSYCNLLFPFYPLWAGGTSA
jgi:hypothetical protein